MECIWELALPNGLTRLQQITSLSLLGDSVPPPPPQPHPPPLSFPRPWAFVLAPYMYATDHCTAFELHKRLMSSKFISEVLPPLPLGSHTAQQKSESIAKHVQITEPDSFIFLDAISTTAVMRCSLHAGSCWKGGVISPVLTLYIEARCKRAACSRPGGGAQEPWSIDLNVIEHLPALKGLVVRTGTAGSMMRFLSKITSLPGDRWLRVYHAIVRSLIGLHFKSSR